MRAVLKIRALLLVVLISVSLQAFAQTESTEPLAIQYYQNGEYDKALPLFEVLFNKTPDPRFYQYYLDCLVRTGDFKTAEKFVSRQQKKHPDDPRYLVDLGYVFQLAGNEKESHKQYELAFRNVYPDLQAYTDLTNAFLGRGLTDYALRTLQKGKKVLRFEPGLNLQLAELYDKTGAFESALDEYLELLDAGGEYFATIQGKLQDLLSVDPDQTKNERFRVHLLSMIRKYPEKTLYAELLLWYFIQQKDFQAAFVQARSLDKRTGTEGQRVFSLGGLAVANEDYDAAIECFNYIIAQGNFNPYWYSARIDLLDARYLKVTRSINFTRNDLLLLEKDYQEVLDEMGQNAQTVPLIRNLAHIKAFYLQKESEGTALLEAAIRIPGIKATQAAECKLELADIMLMSGEVWEATLLYSQVEKAFKNDPIGHEAKFRNAKLSFYIGEFEWAQAQLDVLKAATSKLIANDALQLSLLISDNLGEDSIALPLQIYARADLLLFRNQEDESLRTLDSVRMLEMYHPLFDEVLYKKAEIYIRKRDYQTADSLLRQLYEYYPDDLLGDDALMKLAGLQENIFNNKVRAMELYLELMTRYPGSLYVVEARRKYRELRGDRMNP